MSDNETLKVYNPCDDVRNRIEEYFGDANIESLHVSMVGNNFTAEVEYVDFKPSRSVRKDLDRMFPNVEFTMLKRSYRYESYLKILQEMFDNDEQIYIRRSDGALCPMTLCECLSERMYYRAL